MGTAEANEAYENMPYPAQERLKRVLSGSNSPLMKLTEDTIGCVYYCLDMDGNWLETAQSNLAESEDAVIVSLTENLIAFEKSLRRVDNEDWLSDMFEFFVNPAMKRKKSFINRRLSGAWNQTRVLALDRIRWCLDKAECIPHQLVFHPYVKPTKELAILLDFVNNWRPVLLNFKETLEAIKSKNVAFKEALVNKGKGVETSSAVTDSNTFVTLLKLEDEVVKTGHEVVIQANFARAAMALRLLAEVSSKLPTRRQLVT